MTSSIASIAPATAWRRSLGAALLLHQVHVLEEQRHQRPDGRQVVTELLQQLRGDGGGGAGGGVTGSAVFHRLTMEELLWISPPPPRVMGSL